MGGRQRVHGSILAALTAGDGVERGADGAPVAFRIWKAGANPTDMGVHVFSQKSAELLMAEQAARGNDLSFDVDHMSLNVEAPIENHAAVGWHKLALRQSANGPELWAVDCRWDAEVKAGLTKQPPAWKYFSPAYDVAKETGEIVGYLNCAVTNNPATWSVTALATATQPARGHMNFTAIAAGLFGDDPEKKKEARAQVAGMNELEKKAWKAYQKAALEDGDGDEKPKDGEGEPTKGAEEPAKEAAKAAEEPPKATKAAEEPKDDKEAKAATAATADLLKKLGDSDKRLAELEAVKEQGDREKILATRPDLTKAQRDFLQKQPVGRVEELLALIPKPETDPAAAARVTATRGSHDGTEEVRAARLPPTEHRELRERFGLQDEALQVGWGGPGGKFPQFSRNDRVFPAIDKVEAKRMLSARKAPLPYGRKEPPAASAGNGGGK